jgi:glycosyltransferase involved in cell wall biosynthesis
VLQRGFNLLREIGRTHEVDLLAFHHPDELSSKDALAQSRTELGRFCRNVEYFRLWPKRSGVHSLAAFAFAALHPAPFSVIAQRNRLLAKRISEICGGRGAPDLVHLDTLGLVPYAACCGKVPAVLAHHNIESQLMQRRAEHERGALKRRYVESQAARLRRYESEVCGRFPLNITVSSADASSLAAICPGVRTVVIPNGVDTNYFQPRSGGETPAIVFTGGMNMFANRDAVEWFLDAIWPAIKSRVPGAELLVIGQRPCPRALEAAASDPAVQVPGHVPDIRPWVARASVYVVPMRVGGGTRLKVVDAMAQGKAIVSTRLGAEGLDVQGGVHLELADDPREFADKVVDLLSSPVARRRLGEAGRACAESHYAWDRLGHRLGAAYEQVVKDSLR